MGLVYANIELINGYDLEMAQGIPWQMLTFTEVVKSMTFANALITVKERKKAYVIPCQNIHVMDKEYLLSDNFADFLESVCTN